MSPQHKRATALSIFLLIGLLICAFAFWPRESVPPKDSVSPKIDAPVDLASMMVYVTPEKAAKLAIDDVKKRYGWSGKADRPVMEGDVWVVTVWREPKDVVTNRRVVAISPLDGEVFPLERH